MDLRTDSTGDLAIVNGELDFVDKAAAIAQHITMRLRTFLGESPYDRAAGVPYVSVILQPATPNFAREQILNAVVLGTPGVTSSQITVTLDAATQTLRASGVATGLNVPIEFAVEVEV
jgi:hypothetical protein